MNYSFRLPQRLRLVPSWLLFSPCRQPLLLAVGVLVIEMEEFGLLWRSVSSQSRSEIKRHTKKLDQYQNIQS